MPSYINATLEATVEGQFYTIKEVSEHLKISISTIRRAVRTGRLAVTRVGAQKQIRVNAQALQDFLNDEPSQDAPSGLPTPMGTREAHHTEPTAATAATAVSAISSDVSIARFDGQSKAGLNWAVLNGDVRAALGELPDESIHCAVTSPPYYWQRDYLVDGQIGHEATIDEYVTALVDTFRGVRRALRKDGTLFLNLGDTYYSAKGRPHGKDDKHSGRAMMRRHLRAVDGPGLGIPRKSLIGIPWRVALAMQQDGWTLRSSILWQRPASMPEPTAHDRPWRTFEHVFLFSKSPKYFFNREGLVNEEDIWTIIARPENPGAHFAPYPRELVERCLACGCPEGGVVLDPFVGSGTTMAAALSRGSPAIGIDLKPEYCAFTVQRLEKEFGSNDLFADLS